MTSATTSNPIFAALSADDAENQLTEIESLCMNCYSKGHTRLLLTRIPYYKDVILSSFECDSCHFKNNDIQPAQRIESYGISVNVHVVESTDLNRQFVKSSYGTVRINELDFEQAPYSENGLLTTIEGFLDSIIENINNTIKQIDEAIDEINKSSTNQLTDEDQKSMFQFREQKQKLSEFIARVEACKNLSQTFHFELDDPSGNSYIENPKAPHRDNQMITKTYQRTLEQNSLLGVTEEETPAAENGLPAETAESIKDEVLNFGTNCPHCNAPCETHMKLTQIPYFKEVIIMATTCDSCGQKSNEVKSGTGIGTEGVRYSLVMNDPTDLNRDVLVSETASFSIPDLDFELSSSRSIGGRFTTIEGIFTTLRSQLASVVMPFSGGDSSTHKSAMATFMDDISAILAGEKFVTIVLDDPAGNCYLQNVCAPEPDPQLTVEHYQRDYEQNELLGLNDMKVEDYEDS